MDNAMAALIDAAAGTGAPINPSSQYYGAEVKQMTFGGKVVAYLSRRILPQPYVYSQTQSYSVSAGDRTDILAARFLGDPLLYWMICDANGGMDPEELTAEPGRVILIPLMSGIPVGARNG